jgi:hypothetical protein
MPEIPGRAGKDELAAAGAPHLPAGDEGREPLSQSPVRTTVAACRRAATTTDELDLLPLTPSARPACRDDLPVPADPGERAHGSAENLLGHGHSRMILASTGLLWRRTSPAS